MSHKKSTEDERVVLEMYKCHYTPMETTKKVSIGYNVVCMYFRSFRLTGVEKYDRLNLVPGEITNDAKAINE